jgi:methylisocitrate lyase
MKFREMLARNQAHLAPAVFNPLSAKLAEQAGFQMLYLSGGALGYIKCSLEANLSLTEVIQTGVEIRAACELPLIMDGICGWGDPMHVGFTVKTAEAVGFCAIEIEDQLLPKRAHHHAGIEHMIPRELMAAKVREAVRARKIRTSSSLPAPTAFVRAIWMTRCGALKRITRLELTCYSSFRAPPKKPASLPRACRRL